MDEVKHWLKDQGLDHLTDLFLSQGFDELFIISQLDEARLEELGINKIGVKMKLLDRINKLKSNNVGTPILSNQGYPIQNIDASSLESLYPSNVQSYYRPQHVMMTPDRSKGRLYGRGPYRCNLCCELKIRDTETKTKHICKPELIGHRWEDCPTHYLANHPEALAKMKEEKKEAKRLKKEEKKKEKDLQRWQPRKKRKDRPKEEEDLHQQSPESDPHLNNAALAQIEKIRQNIKLIVDNPMLWTERMETDNTFLTIMLSLYEHLTSFPDTPDSGPSSPQSMNGTSSMMLQTNGLNGALMTGPMSHQNSQVVVSRGPGSPDLHNHPQSVPTGSVTLNAQTLSPSQVSPQSVPLHPHNSPPAVTSHHHHHRSHLEC